MRACLQMKRETTTKEKVEQDRIVFYVHGKLVIDHSNLFVVYTYQDGVVEIDAIQKQSNVSMRNKSPEWTEGI